MSSKISLENLAVMFRTNDPNIGHVSTLEAMTDCGLAYMLGYYRGIPKCHERKRASAREAIVRALELKIRGAQ